jgi:hypothetical protein
MVTPSTLPNCGEMKQWAHLEDFIFAQINDVGKKACCSFRVDLLVSGALHRWHQKLEGWFLRSILRCAAQVVRLCVSSILSTGILYVLWCFRYSLSVFSILYPVSLYRIEDLLNVFFLIYRFSTSRPR